MAVSFVIFSSAISQAEVAIICGNENENKAIAHADFDSLSVHSKKDVKFLNSLGKAKPVTAASSRGHLGGVIVNVLSETQTYSFTFQAAGTCDGDVHGAFNPYLVITKTGAASGAPIKCFCVED